MIAAHGVETVPGPPGRLLVTYAHTTGASLTVRAGSHVLHVLVTTRDDAGRAWFFEADGKDLVVIGPNLVRPSSDGLELSYESRAADDRVLTWSVEPLALAGFTADSARESDHRRGMASPCWQRAAGRRD